MFCTKCGNKIEDGVKFCTSCGAPVAGGARGTEEAKLATSAADEVVATSDGASSISASPAASNKAPFSAKKKVVIGVVIAILVVVVAAACVLLGGYFSDHQNEDDLSQHLDEKISDASSAPTFESKCFQIFLPEDLADKISFVEKNNTVSIKYVPTDIIFATLFPQGEALAGEDAHRTYLLGEVYIGGHYEEAKLDCYYIEDNGQIAHWGSKKPREIGLEKLLGISCEDFISYIRVNTGSEYIPAQVEMISDDPGIAETSSAPNAQSVESDGAKPPQEPFWGIWVGASKDKDEMDALAQQLKDEGIGNGIVIMTTDWDNLNTEPWWVVSVGQYASEDAALSVLENIKQHGYPNAYVKYSGTKK